MKLASLFSAAAVLGVTAMASAQVNIIVVGTPDTVTSNATGQSYTRYTVALDNVGAGNIGAFDIRFDGAMHQAQLYIGAPSASVFQDNAVLISDANRLAVDSHILFNSTDVTIASDPGNPNLRTPSEGLVPASGANDSGFARQDLSNFLQTGTAALAGGLQANQVTLAQLVLPAGGFVTVSGNAAITGETTPRVVSGIVGVPEPTSLALLGLGGLALARRRMA